MMYFMEKIDKIAEIITLKVNFSDSEGSYSIYPAVLRDESNVILVDCGYQGFLPLLEDAMRENGLSFADITGIVITHHDHDHFGALHEIKEKYPHIVTMSSLFDAPFIEGKKKSLRLVQALDIYDTLPEREKEDAMEFQKTLEAVKPVGIDRALRDGDILPWCGGTEIIGTPGHMPGHISLYVRRHNAVITGDALVGINGRLRVANRYYSLDLDSAKKSAKKLLELNAEKYICYHGGVITPRKI
ncbi:MAG: MBL fold metallo-hydrolase [Synergistaceae bacterium]|jgi:glyoxylase-like metal-dependent hydrolase (beta-lactamase superfamily II)|nr:MBL fold metallo-hydrolase [Synergistaceae bacterium]